MVAAPKASSSNVSRYSCTARGALTANPCHPPAFLSCSAQRSSQIHGAEGRSPEIYHGGSWKTSHDPGCGHSGRGGRTRDRPGLDEPRRTSRAQSGNCCNSVNFYAAMRRENRSARRAAAQTTDPTTQAGILCCEKAILIAPISELTDKKGAVNFYLHAPVARQDAVH
jgi:hypothetical protein